MRLVSKADGAGGAGEVDAVHMEDRPGRGRFSGRCLWHSSAGGSGALQDAVRADSADSNMIGCCRRRGEQSEGRCRGESRLRGGDCGAGATCWGFIEGGTWGLVCF